MANTGHRRNNVFRHLEVVQTSLLLLESGGDVRVEKIEFSFVFLFNYFNYIFVNVFSLQLWNSWYILSQMNKKDKVYFWLCFDLLKIYNRKTKSLITKNWFKLTNNREPALKCWHNKIFKRLNRHAGDQSSLSKTPLHLGFDTLNHRSLILFQYLLSKEKNPFIFNQRGIAAVTSYMV